MNLFKAMKKNLADNGAIAFVLMLIIAISLSFTMLSLIYDVLIPYISYLISIPDMSNLQIVLKEKPNISIKYGNVIQLLIIVSVVIFSLFLSKAAHVSEAFKRFVARSMVIDFILFLIVFIPLTVVLDSLVRDILMPCIEYLIDSKIYALKHVLKDYIAPTETKAGEGGITIYYGYFFVRAIITLTIILSLFIGIQLINRVHRSKT